MKWRNQLFISLAMTIPLIVSGCQSPTGSTASKGDAGEKKEAVAANQGKVLKLMIPNYFNDIEKKQWMNVVAKFQELNPDIKIDLTTGDMQVENGKLTTMLQSGVTPPDALLINAGAGRVKILADANLIQPMNEAYKQNNWQDKIKPFAYNLVSGNDKVYELPHSMDAMQVYYHKDIFEKQGIQVPTTKDEFMTALSKLKAAGIAPIAVGARDRFPISWMFSTMLESAAGRQAMEQTLYGDGKWNSPEITKTIEMLADWVKNGYISKDSISLTAADAKFSFLNKKTAMAFYSSQIIVDAVENKVEDNLGTFTLPSFIEGQTSAPASGLGTTWVIPAKAEHTDLAMTWMNFVLSADFSKVVLSDPSYNYILVSKNAASQEPAGQLLKQVMKAVEQGSGYNPAVFIGPETKEAYFQNLQGIVGGLTTPKEAADKIQAGKDKDTAAGYKITKK
ncbi:ABC transporter substrate-binding protein [Paenibacillus puerhi]|uniref:ABC transporter substrate-binding protein n=1 Tax=Paenibacillus puerhi TaxID=2692622 RepID=UPI001358695D|nr:extracellular solute-binding protein [Paenibacillus puerhi]